MFNNILVICTGNICRSPMGEVLLRHHLQPKGVKVLSAGTGAMVGYPADPMSVAVAAQHGYDLSAHRAQQATLPMLSAMVLILTLDQSHNDWLNRNYPQLRGRVHKLLKWGGNYDVEDPYQHPREAFEEAWTEIAVGVGDWLKKLG